LGNPQQLRDVIWHCEPTMKDKLIIVVDLGLLKAYRIDVTPQKTRRLEQLQEIVLEEAHTRLKDRVTDSSGRHRAPTQKNHSAPMTDDHNLKLEEKRRLIRKIAGQITDLIQHNAKNGCWLAAPKEINLQLLNELRPAIRQRIQKCVPCDFTKLSPPKVLEHFLDRAAL
jgi:hypothetical protein